MIRWNTAFIDRPAARFDEASAFWTAVSGTHLSERRGENGEFATLLPAEGDSCLRIQGVGDAGGAHLDLDVALEDLPEMRNRAMELGATVVADHHTFTYLRSPHGKSFCLTTERGDQVPAPVTAPDGTRSRVDQVCLDIGASDFDREAHFWSALTGWELRSSLNPEFLRLAVPDQLPIRILLQRLEEDREPGAHIDIACADADTVAAWHEKLGAQRVYRGSHWLAMTDPAGGVYCLTNRNPDTGRVPE